MKLINAMKQAMNLWNLKLHSPMNMLWNTQYDRPKKVLWSFLRHLYEMHMRLTDAMNSLWKVFYLKTSQPMKFSEALMKCIWSWLMLWAVYEVKLHIPMKFSEALIKLTELSAEISIDELWKNLTSTTTTRSQCGYEVVNSQRGAKRRVGYNHSYPTRANGIIVLLNSSLV